MLKRVNQHRRGMGLPALAHDDRVAALARDHSRAMADGRRAFGHGRFAERAAALHLFLEVAAASENVARNTYPMRLSGEAAVRGWVESAGHRENLEAAAATLTGVGVAIATTGEVFVTQMYVSTF